MTGFIKKFILTSTIVALLGGIPLLSAQAALLDNPGLTESGSESQTDSFRDAAGFSSEGNNTVGSIIATVIEAFLTLLGIIFLILMLIGGYKWMTAGGNEDQIKEAKSYIKNAVIGLAIIIMAYAITYFVFEALGDSVGGGGQSYPP